MMYFCLKLWDLYIKKDFLGDLLLFWKNSGLKTGKYISMGWQKVISLEYGLKIGDRLCQKRKKKN